MTLQEIKTNYSRESAKIDSYLPIHYLIYLIVNQILVGTFFQMFHSKRFIAYLLFSHILYEFDLGIPYCYLQENIFQEMYSIFGDSERSPTMDDIRRMEYLGMVIKESARYYPTVPIIVRDLTQDVILGKSFISREWYELIVVFDHVFSNSASLLNRLCKTIKIIHEYNSRCFVLLYL